MVHRQNPRSFLACTFLALVVISGGCGKTKYGCPVPDGVTCRSMTQVYFNHAHPENAAQAAEAEPGRYVTPEVLEGPIPIRRAPKVIRIWLAPWIDQDEDLHQPGYIYAEIKGRKWLMGEYASYRNGTDSGTEPLPPPAAQQKAMTELEKERDSLAQASRPPVAPSGTPPLPDMLGK